MKHIHRFSLTVVVAISYLFVPLSSYGPQLEIYALDVGQGDSTLIVTPSKTRILIDGGRDSAVITQLDKVIPFWDREIDLVMLTHPDFDHVGGLIDVLGSFKVNSIALTPIQSDSEVYKLLKERIKYWKVQPRNFMRGSRITTSDGVTIKGLWPTVDSLQSMETNDNSQVGLLRYQLFTGLFTGDIDTEVADRLEDDSFLEDIDYLKVPHHGSKYGLTAGQLKKLSPEISTISVGTDNQYGHPNATTITNLKNIRSEIWRTDKDGLIHVVVNQSGLSVRSE